MPNPISDKVLGSRFWLVNDFQSIDANDNASMQVHVPEQNRVAPKVKHDAKIFSFVNEDQDNEMARSAINKAELFAASHTLSVEQREQERVQALQNGTTLLGSQNAVEEFLQDAIATFGHRFEGKNGDEPCRTASESSW